MKIIQFDHFFANCLTPSTSHSLQFIHTHFLSLMKMFCACFWCLTSFAPISSYHSCLEISLRFEWCCSPDELFSWSPLQKHFSITQRIRRYICRSMNGGGFFMGISWIGKYTHFSMDPAWVMSHDSTKKQNKKKINRPVFSRPPPPPKPPSPKKTGFSYFFLLLHRWLVKPPPGAALSRVPGAGLLRSRPFGWGRRLEGSRENDARDTGAQHFEGSKSVSGRPSDPRKGKQKGNLGDFLGFFWWLGYYKGWHFLPYYMGIIVNHH